jgi:hypothetical protein
LADNNPRRKKPGILIATQDKNIVKRKHALENELKMYQKLLNTFFVCSQRRLLHYLEAAVES